MNKRRDGYSNSGKEEQKKGKNRLISTFLPPAVGSPLVELCDMPAKEVVVLAKRA
jgi:hypothetical protein